MKAKLLSANFLLYSLKICDYITGAITPVFLREAKLISLILMVCIEGRSPFNNEADFQGAFHFTAHNKLKTFERGEDIHINYKSPYYK